MAKKREIRNSTAEFLIFQIEGKEQGVEVFYKDKTVWCTQKTMGMLFDCSTDNIGLHLKNIFASGELVKDSVTEKISATASDGKNYVTQFYNLDAVISVGYRVNSIRATQFRQWAFAICPAAFRLQWNPIAYCKPSAHLFQNKGCFHHNANDRFGRMERLMS